MKTIATPDQALQEAVDALAREFESDISTKNGDSQLSAAEYVATVQKKFESTLRERLQQVESKVQSGNDATIDVETKPPSDESSAASGDFHTVDHQPPQPPIDSGDGETVDFVSSEVIAGRGETVDFASQPTERDTRSSAKKPHHKTEGDGPEGYEILGRLGKGGMGVVYKAKHIPLNRTVAIKMVLAGKHASQKILTRFRAEAEAAARLTHPHIISVYEVGEHQGMPFFSLEYVDGEELSSLLTEASMTDARSVELMEKIARAVDYSHKQGIVHRDLKPQNVMIDQEGEPKVADFGLAKRLDDPENDQTKTGEIMGTPGYMAPEQARGVKNIGPHTDIYSLGAVMYHMLTGRAPFVGPTPFETIKQVIAEEPASPSRLQPGLDRDLETICLKCLEKEPEKRYASAADLADDLQRVREGKPIVARPVTHIERATKWCKRNPRIASLLAVAGTLLLALIIGGYTSAAVINGQKISEREAKEDALAAQSKAQEEEKKANTARIAAEESEHLANDQAELALNATRVVLFKTQAYFKKQPQLNKLRQEMLDGILKEVDEVYRGDYKYDVKEVFRASAIRQLGQIYYEFGETEKALKLFLESDEIARGLFEKGELAQAHRSLDVLDQSIGDALRDLGRFDEAEKRYLSALEHRRRYFKQNPNIPKIAQEQALIDIYEKLATLMSRRGRPDEARRYNGLALEGRQRWFDMFEELQKGKRIRHGRLERLEKLAGAWGQYSKVCEKAGDFAEMEKASQKSLTLLEESKRKKPDEFEATANVGMRKFSIGRQYLITQRFEDADRILSESIDDLKTALQRNPDKAAVTTNLAHAFFYRGIAADNLEQPSAEFYERAISIQRGIIAKSKSIWNRGPLLLMVARSGEVKEAQDMADAIRDENYKIASPMFSAIAYALLADRMKADSKDQADLREKAIAGVRNAIREGYHDFGELRVAEVNLAVIQPVEAYQAMLDAEETRVLEANRLGSAAASQ